MEELERKRKKREREKDRQNLQKLNEAEDKEQ
jgi:hypothetical protein